MYTSAQTGCCQKRSAKQQLMAGTDEEKKSESTMLLARLDDDGDNDIHSAFNKIPDFFFIRAFKIVVDS